MLKPISQPIRFAAFFTANKQGKSGLAPTIDIYKNGVAIITGTAATENGGGLYSYTLAGASVDVAGNYIAIFKTTDTSVDLQHVPSYFAAGENWIERLLQALPSATAGANGGLLLGDGTGRVDIGKWLGTEPLALNEQMVQTIVASYAPGKAPPSVGDIRAAVEAAGTALDILLTRLTHTRAEYLDRLNISGQVASSGEVTALQNNTSTRFVVPSFFERPDADSTSFVLHLYIYDETGNMKAPDTVPTIAVTNESGVSRVADLSAVSLVTIGHYKATYTVTNNATVEQLFFEATITENGATRYAGGSSFVVDTTAVDFTAADRTTLSTILDAMALQSSLEVALSILATLEEGSNNAPASQQTADAVRALLTDSVLANAAASGVLREPTHKIDSSSDGAVLTQGPVQL